MKGVLIRKCCTFDKIWTLVQWKLLSLMYFVQQFEIVQCSEAPKKHRRSTEEAEVP